MRELNKFVHLYARVKSDRDKKRGKHWWIVPLNEALEKVCSDSPGHADPARVYAKVRLINRAYAANLERNRTVKWAEGEVAKALARKLIGSCDRFARFGRLMWPA